MRIEGMVALILAGGRGTRLRPLTFGVPKPLIAVRQVPIIVRLINRLRAAGIETIYVSTGYLGFLIEAAVRSFNFDVEIFFLAEGEPLGTAGPLSLLKGKLNSSENCIFLINGDILTDLDICEFHEYHLQSMSDLSVATCYHEERLRYGVTRVRDDKSVIVVEEKPNIKYTINIGAYIINKAIIEDLEGGLARSMPELINDSVSSGLRVHVYYHLGEWMPIEDIDDLMRAENSHIS